MTVTKEKAKQILALLDSDIQAAQPALEKAVALARRQQASLTLYVNAWSAALERRMAHDRAQLPALSEALISAWENNLRHQLDTLDAPDTETLIVWESAEKQTLIDLLLTRQPDLLVLNRSSEPALQRWLMTPRDWRMIRKAPCAVLCVGEQPWPAQPAVLAALDPDTDSDERAALNDRIIAAARQLANDLSGQLSLAQVVEYPDETLVMLAGEAVPVSLNDVDNLRHYYRQRLQETAQHYQLGADQALLLEGAPHRALAEQMESHPGVLVLGTVHRGAVKRLLLGNTAEQILLHSRSDVLVVKPDDFVSPWVAQ